MNAAMKNITAHETAKVAMDNLRGSLLRLKSAWENLTIKLLDHGVGDGLRSFTDEFGKLTSHFSGLLDDGLQVTDVIKIVGEGINDLKNKFLAFDGIGSVLAGGALAVGLKKDLQPGHKGQRRHPGHPEESSGRYADRREWAPQHVVRKRYGRHGDERHHQQQRGTDHGAYFGTTDERAGSGPRRNSQRDSETRMGRPAQQLGEKGAMDWVGYRIRWNRS